MRKLICRCPGTQQPVDLKLYTDHATLARIRSNSVRFQCPHCGAEHETNVEAAWLEATAAWPTMIVTSRVGQACAQAERETARSAAAPAARCRKFRRGSFMLNLPSHHSITSSALHRSR